MNLPFSHGYDLIIEALKQEAREKSERELFEVYYFGNSNGYNQKYETFKEFMDATLKREPEQRLSADEIKQSTKKMMDKFF